ncbi:MAG: DUF3817 domain-containing protein [Corynebacteriales bacterium]|nr:DUF3817 domain-containing protein [Mycobacteriales bacterium]
MKSPLIRFRVIAYVVGAFLIVLMLIGMPLKYLAKEPIVVDAIGPVHGILYVVYLLAAFDLARRAGWPLKRTLQVSVAGTVPIYSFFVERGVSRELR